MNAIIHEKSILKVANANGVQKASNAPRDAPSSNAHNVIASIGYARSIR